MSETRSGPASVASRRGKAAGSAPPATSATTDPDPERASGIVVPSSSTSAETRSCDGDGSTITGSGSAPTSPISKPFEPPSSASNRQWRTPRNAREFAAQANEIATAVMNGTVDLDAAKTYSAIARTAAQMLTAEVQRARFLRTIPDLSLEWGEVTKPPNSREESPDVRARSSEK